MTVHTPENLTSDILNEEEGKFIRIDNDSWEFRMGTSHYNFAVAQGLLGLIQEKIQTDRAQVDAGRFNRNNSGQTITFLGDSDTLGLPLNQDARDNTVTVYQSAFPDYTVETF